MLLLLQRFALCGCLAASVASAFVVAPAAPAPRSSRSARGGTVMMAQRHYDKMTSRGEFLLKSALATGAFVPVVTGLRNEGNGEEKARAPQQAPLRRDALLEDEEQGEEGAASLSWGPPLEYRKGKGTAMKEMREVIARFEGSVQRQEHGTLRVNFGKAQDLELRFTADGAVRTRVGQRCEDMRRMNLLCEELAAKGGWQVKGYPLCVEPATAKYV